MLNKDYLERVKSLISEDEDATAAIIQVAAESSYITYQLLDAIDNGEIDETRLQRTIDAIPQTLIFLVAAYLAFSKKGSYLIEACESKLVEFEALSSEEGTDE